MRIRRSLFIKAVIFTFSLAFILLGSEIAFAGMGVSPTISEIVVKPEGVTKGVFRVVNDGKDPIHVKVEIEDWLKVRTGVSKVPIDKWLAVTPMEFDITPQGTKEVTYSITVPKGYEGEMVAMIFFSTLAEETGALNITSRFGVSIYAAVEDSIKLDCNIITFKVIRDIEKKPEGGSVDRGFIFVMDVENKGNVHIRPTGNISITAKDGSLYDVKIERGFPVYPGLHLTYAIPWGKKDVKPGKYQAHLVLDYGNIYSIDKKIEKTLSFLVKRDGSISF